MVRSTLSLSYNKSKDWLTMLKRTNPDKYKFIMSFNNIQEAKKYISELFKFNMDTFYRLDQIRGSKEYKDYWNQFNNKFGRSYARQNWERSLFKVNDDLLSTHWNFICTMEKMKKYTIEKGL